MKYAKFYALATQGILSMAVLTLLGFLIGYWIDKHSAWPAILAIVGLLIGLITLISYLLYLLKDEEKRKSKDEQRTED